MFGLSQMALVLEHCFEGGARNLSDLKDKWRHMCDAADRPMGFKFRVDYFTPAMLCEVRAVMAEEYEEQEEPEEGRECECSRCCGEYVAVVEVQAVVGNVKAGDASMNNQTEEGDEGKVEKREEGRGGVGRDSPAAEAGAAA
jgi:hypothetical protein